MGEKPELYCLVFRNSRSREAPEIQIKSTKPLPKVTVRGGRWDPED